jgi:hypothetical protein
MDMQQMQQNTLDSTESILYCFQYATIYVCHRYREAVECPPFHCHSMDSEGANQGDRTTTWLKKVARTYPRFSSLH